MAEAMSCNCQFLQRLKSELKRFISLDDLADARADGSISPYSVTLDYLHRDWGDRPEATAERDAINGAVFSRLSCRPTEVCLVLGAGAGRLAWELTERVGHVLATDLSLMMAYQFSSVLNGPIETYSVVTPNQAEAALRVTSTKAFVPKERLGRGNCLTYFVGDALYLPIQSKSISSIVSVYFSDVVDLEQLLVEMRRVLKPGGEYIHVGPLFYHEREVSQHLAVDEVRCTFQRYGFTLSLEEFVSSTHLVKTGVLAQTTFRNWAFRAILEADVIRLDTILRRSCQVHYLQEGVLSDDSDHQAGVQLSVAASKAYQGEPWLLSVIRDIDGRRSVGQIISRISEEWGVGREHVFGSLERLLLDGVVRRQN